MMIKQKYKGSITIALVILCLLFLSQITVQAQDKSQRKVIPGIQIHLLSEMEQSVSKRLNPEDFTYLGAFRLPDDKAKPRTFEYGGSAMTYSPAGDPGGSQDGFPGSLFIMGHNRQPYGELPDGNQVAEVTIPRPLVSTQVDALNYAAFLQEFRNVAAGQFTTLNEIPRAGMQYLNTPDTGARIHLAWGQHLQEDEAQVPSHAWFNPTLSNPGYKGTWYIGNQSLYSVNGYLMDIPTAWANLNVGGRPLATGRYRDGGWSGMGPALFAYIPWTDGSGTPAPSGSHLLEKVLLLYAKSNETDVIERCLNGYQHADEWEGGAWITTSDGRAAVLFAGTKGTGGKYWYGWINPAGPQYPCVETELIGQFTLCRMADGTACPSEDLTECSKPNDWERGWWSSSFQARFILYDPGDLAKVAAGQIASWQPQPYAVMSIDDRLFMNPSGMDTGSLGTGVQRRNRIGDVAYDRANNLLYVLELFVDGAKPVVHVWRIGGDTGCSGDVIVLQNMTFTSGNTYNCTATTSITAGTGVTVQSGAIVNFKAPKINFQPGFRIEIGAVFSAKQ
jgi:hypothetical protein